MTAIATRCNKAAQHDAKARPSEMVGSAMHLCFALVKKNAFSSTGILTHDIRWEFLESKLRTFKHWELTMNGV